MFNKLLISMCLLSAVDLTAAPQPTGVEEIAYMKRQYPELGGYVRDDNEIEVSFVDFRRLLYQSWLARNIATFNTLRLLRADHFNALQLSHPTMQVFLEEILSSNANTSSLYLNGFIKEGGCNQFGFITSFINVLQKPLKEFDSTGEWKSSITLDKNLMETLQSECQISYDALTSLNASISEHLGKAIPSEYQEVFNYLDDDFIFPNGESRESLTSRLKPMQDAQLYVNQWIQQYLEFLPALVEPKGKNGNAGLNVLNYAIFKVPIVTEQTDNNSGIYFTNFPPHKVMLPAGYQVQMTDNSSYIADTESNERASYFTSEHDIITVYQFGGSKFGVWLAERDEKGYLDVLYNSLWDSGPSSTFARFKTKPNMDYIVYLGLRGNVNSCLKKFAGDSMVFNDQSEMASTIYEAFKKCNKADQADILLSAIIYLK